MSKQVTIREDELRVLVRWASEMLDLYDTLRDQAAAIGVERKTGSGMAEGAEEVRRIKNATQEALGPWPCYEEGCAFAAKVMDEFTNHYRDAHTEGYAYRLRATQPETPCPTCRQPMRATSGLAQVARELAAGDDEDGQ